MRTWSAEFEKMTLKRKKKYAIMYRIYRKYFVCTLCSSGSVAVKDEVSYRIANIKYQIPTFGEVLRQQESNLTRLHGHTRQLCQGRVLIRTDRQSDGRRDKQTDRQTGRQAGRVIVFFGP
jgi:hypothetical protein